MVWAHSSLFSSRKAFTHTHTHTRQHCNKLSKTHFPYFPSVKGYEKAAYSLPNNRSWLSKAFSNLLCSSLPPSPYSPGKPVYLLVSPSLHHPVYLLVSPFILSTCLSLSPSPYIPGRPVSLLVCPSILSTCSSLPPSSLPACLSLHHPPAELLPTWFFPFSISRLVTLPKGRPRLMTSASLMSLGSLRTWMTRDGTPGLRVSPLNFLLSLPLAGRGNSHTQ